MAGRGIYRRSQSLHEEDSDDDEQVCSQLLEISDDQECVFKIYRMNQEE